MPFKIDAQGNIVTADSNGAKLPVFVHPDGKETPFDADATIGTISRLNAEAKAHREGKESAEKLLKSFEGLDAAAAREALDKLKTLDLNKLVDKGEVEKVKAEVKAALEAQYGPTVKERDTLREQLNAHLVGGVFSGSKFVAEKFAGENAAVSAQIARALFAGNFKVEDGKVVAYDASGQKLYSRARPGEVADAEEALQLIVEASPLRASILKGANASGSGAGGSGGQGGTGGQKTVTRAQFDAMPQHERAAHAKAGGKVTD